MHILLTGGTGFLGADLTKRLASQGHHVRLLVRSPEKAKEKFSNEPAKILDQLEFWQGDITDPASLTGLLDDREIIYHFAGMLGQAGVPDQRFWDLNTTGTRNLLKLAQTQGNIKRFIHCGSAGVQGPIQNPPADESVPLAPSNIYEETKAAAEEAVITAYQKKGLPTVVLRPEFVYGPGDLHVMPLFEAIKKGMFVIFGNGSTQLHPSFIDDVTDAFMLALDTPDIEGEVFIIAAEKPVSVNELVYGIADTLDVRRPFHIPAWLGMTLGSILETLGKLTGIDPPLNKARVKYFLEVRAFDVSKAQKILGYTPQHTWRQGVAKTINWYHAEGHLKK